MSTSPKKSKELRRGGMVSMGDAMKNYLDSSGLGAKLRDWPVYDAWRDALGPVLSRRARAVAFRRGELVVEVESAAHKQELESFTGEQYRRLANQRLRSERIARVVFKLKR